MHLGILLTGHTIPEIVAHYGEYDALFRRFFGGRGWRFTTWRVVDMEFPASPHDADAWLLTGSKHGAYDDLPFIPPLEEFIRRADAAAVPMVGICFGHQIIAQALGGRVEKFSGGWSLGPRDYALPDLGTVRIGAWHQDQVVEPPERAEVIAATPFCANAAMRIDDHILTLQPHPEFDHAFLTDFIARKRADPSLPAEALDAAEAGLDRPLDGALVADWLAGFLEARVAAKPEERMRG